MSIKGAIFGGAYGDALGRPTEFMTYPEILHRYRAAGPSNVSVVTDDTQMTLYLGDALMVLEAVHHGEFPESAAWLTQVREVRQEFTTAFVRWNDDPESHDRRRAPGGTCLNAVGKLAEGKPWLHATDPRSKGCGANMRVHPIGLARWLPDELVAPYAQMQAALTHGHPTALAAADLTAWAARFLAIYYVGADELVDTLYDYAQSQRKVYHAEWLEGLWRLSRKRAWTPKRFIARGWDEMIGCLEILRTVQMQGFRRNIDPCQVTGAGWIAEEALATALYCFLRYPEDPTRAVRTAAVTSGDSDSIASITGVLAGAVHGIEGFPAAWQERVEYRDRLRTLTDVLSGVPQP